MSIIAGSPDSLTALATRLHDAAEELERTAVLLRPAIDRFATSASVGAVTAMGDADLLPLRLSRRSGELRGGSAEVAAFVDALVAADRMGLARELGIPVVGRVVVTTPALFSLAADVAPATIGESLQELRRRRDQLSASVGAGNEDDAAELGSLEVTISQLEAIIGDRPTGWAGVGSVSWPSLAALMAAAALGRRQAMTIAARPEYALDKVHWVSGFERRHPFLAAAVEHDVLITPDRFQVLRRLDEIVELPMDEFVALAEDHSGSDDRFDWRTDGCSGPVIARARDNCLRHDFFYRNARMVRDQWGLDPGFAEQIKDISDGIFEDDVWGDTPWWHLNPIEWLMSGSAGVGVRHFGSVDSAWTAPHD